MTVTSIVAVVAPRTGKIIENGTVLLKRGENFLQRIYTDEKVTFLKGA